MQKHGSFKIERYQQIIIVRFYNAWNQQTSVQMCREFLQEAKLIADKPWACLIDLREWGLGGPEVWQPIIETNHWCADNNQRFEAVVCHQKIQEFILKDLQQHLPDTESNFFTSETEALLWLSENGFSK